MTKSLPNCQPLRTSISPSDIAALPLQSLSSESNKPNLTNTEIFCLDCDLALRQENKKRSKNENNSFDFMFFPMMQRQKVDSRFLGNDIWVYKSLFYNSTYL